MNATNSFTVARQAEAVSQYVFWILTLASVALLIFSSPNAELIIQPILVVGTAVSIVSGIVITIYQNHGNRLQRTSQLSDALGVALGERIREGYYNNSLSPSVARLATTTFENTLFTKSVLSKMLSRERLSVSLYFISLLLLLSCRGASLGWIVLLAQTLFSTDVIINWLRMERFRVRTSDIHDRLRQYYVQGGSSDQPNNVAVALAAFSDYECAKDEAAMPLDNKIFDKLNTKVSKQWDAIKAELNIP